MEPKNDSQKDCKSGLPLPDFRTPQSWTAARSVLSSRPNRGIPCPQRHDTGPVRAAEDVVHGPEQKFSPARPSDRASEKPSGRSTQTLWQRGEHGEEHSRLHPPPLPGEEADGGLPGRLFYCCTKSLFSISGYAMICKRDLGFVLQIE